MKRYLKIIMLGAVLLNVACSDKNGSVVIIPEGVYMPPLKMLDVDVPGNLPLTKTLAFKLRTFGNVSVENCYLDTNIEHQYQRVTVSLNKIVCNTPSGESQLDASGYIIDDDGKNGLSVVCDQGKQCHFTSKSAKILILDSLDLSGFAFITKDTPEKVYLGFDQNVL